MLSDGHLMRHASPKLYADKFRHSSFWLSEFFLLNLVQTSQYIRFLSSSYFSQIQQLQKEFPFSFRYCCGKLKHCQQYLHSREHSWVRHCLYEAAALPKLNFFCPSRGGNSFWVAFFIFFCQTYTQNNHCWPSWFTHVLPIYGKHNE